MQNPFQTGYAAPRPRKRPLVDGDFGSSLDALPEAPGAAWDTSYGGAAETTTPPIFEPSRPPGQPGGGYGTAPAPTPPTWDPQQAARKKAQQPTQAPPKGYPTVNTPPTWEPSLSKKAQQPTGPVSPLDPVGLDRQARGIFGDLKAAGHDVKWQGEQLIVDGRPYLLGDGPAASLGGEAEEPEPTAELPAPPAEEPPLGQGPGPIPEPTQDFPTDDPAPSGSPGTPANPRGWTREQYRDAWMSAGEMTPAQMDAWLAANGGTLLSGNGTVMTPFGEVLDMGIGRRAAEAGQGMIRPGWTGQGGGGSAGAMGGWQPSYLGGAGGQGGVAGFGGRALDPRFSYEHLQSLMANPQMDAYISSLLEQPESLSEHAVGSMKARMKDTLAEQQQFEDQDLAGWGSSMGIADSPWMASERATGRRSRNQAIARGAQDIDIEAAQSRMADRRAAGSLGQAWQGLKGQQLSMALGSELQARGLNFNYDQLAQQNDQFLRDLTYRLDQLAQLDRQFGAQYGLNFRRLNQDIDRDAWEREQIEGWPA